LDSAAGAGDSGDPRVYFAAERTLLAWIRTGLAMMGFGFVVARFGLFLREMAALHTDAPPPSHGLSLWVGTTLVLLGVGVNLFAVVVHWRTVQRLVQGKPIRFRRFSLASLVALVLGLLGLVTAAYLLFGLHGAR
jgi:putative membrane protein